MRVEPQFDPCEKKVSQIARSSNPGLLTAPCGAPTVAIAPSTERPRLMALRSAVASAEVSREAGRRRHRLGAFSFGSRSRAVHLLAHGSRRDPYPRRGAPASPSRLLDR